MLLDRKTVTVVAGNVRRVEAHHRARFDDEVFEHFVHRGAEMDVGVGVGRPVVKDELLASGAGAADQVIEVELLPFFEARGFASSFAFCEKLVLGRLTVFFRSKGVSVDIILNSQY